MQTKLTLRMDEELIRKAKEYSARRGKSISGIVADYFAAIAVEPPGEQELSPRVRSLVGTIRGDADESQYRKHLQEKHK